ncbi:hypothetical protein [Nocardioides sp. B-3]|uniref:hypothetical protein n=1 Tax=Nocardioides sp. B-3 TaxID=2895565 RepID=UPI0021522B7C|nr:hypothetical protein [Nocardioides sp. B-3]UUZ58418.1 hypothetical protein LP418_19820 [Nocardioides sp. B-3]
MSVDQRICQAFADVETPSLPEVNRAMDRVLVAERRGRARRRAALASGVAAAVAAGAVLWGVLPDDGAESPTPAPPAPSQSATSSGAPGGGVDDQATDAIGHPQPPGGAGPATGRRRGGGRSPRGALPVPSVCPGNPVVVAVRDDPGRQARRVLRQ